jgi:GT2 family glycosyltransferase
VEERLGLSEARNRGVAEARYDLLAFIDDDAFPLEGWLESIVAAFDNPEVMGAGGPVDPMIEGELPSWFRGRYLPLLTVWDLGPEPVELKYFEYPRGANMAFRREVFTRWGGFSPYLGRKGASLLSCEETELCLRVERGGGRIMYAPGARVRHLTVADRITPKWMLNRCEAQGKSEAIFNWQHAKLEGLHIGLKCQIRRWRSAREERPYTGRLFEACRRKALVGYIKGIPHAILRTPLYQPLLPWEEPAPWVPFG